MKLLFILLFLASCTSAPKQPKAEPWAAGDCVAWKPRALIGQIHKVIPPNEDGGEYLYGIQYFAEEKKDKVLEVIPCPKE